MNYYKVLVCDDHPVLRAGLRLILKKEKEFQLVGEAESVEQAVELAVHLQPDLILLDITMPGVNGLDAIPLLQAAAPKAKVLILTVHDEEIYFFQTLQAGAAGYVLKDASVSELLAALQLVMQGGVPIPHKLVPKLLNDYTDQADQQVVPGSDTLSTREREILSRIRKGCTNKQIAEELYLSVRTVERHRSSIMRKAGLQNRAELVAYAVRQGLLYEGEQKQP